MWAERKSIFSNSISLAQNAFIHSFWKSCDAILIVNWQPISFFRYLADSRKMPYLLFFYFFRIFLFFFWYAPCYILIVESAHESAVRRELWVFSPSGTSNSARVRIFRFDLIFLNNNIFYCICFYWISKNFKLFLF